jgi:hypothetical protein
MSQISNTKPGVGLDKFRRGSTLSPISSVKISSALKRLNGDLEYAAVFRIHGSLPSCSGSISPKPLYVGYSIFFPTVHKIGHNLIVMEIMNFIAPFGSIQRLLGNYRYTFFHQLPEVPVKEGQQQYGIWDPSTSASVHYEMFMIAGFF